MTGYENVDNETLETSSDEGVESFDSPIDACSSIAETNINDANVHIRGSHGGKKINIWKLAFCMLLLQNLWGEAIQYYEYFVPAQTPQLRLGCDLPKLMVDSKAASANQTEAAKEAANCTESQEDKGTPLAGQDEHSTEDVVHILDKEAAIRTKSQETKGVKRTSYDGQDEYSFKEVFKALERISEALDRVNRVLEKEATNDAGNARKAGTKGTSSANQDKHSNEEVLAFNVFQTLVRVLDNKLDHGTGEDMPSKLKGTKIGSVTPSNENSNWQLGRMQTPRSCEQSFVPEKAQQIQRSFGVHVYSSGQTEKLRDGAAAIKVNGEDYLDGFSGQGFNVVAIDPLFGNAIEVSTLHAHDFARMIKNLDDGVIVAVAVKRSPAIDYSGTKDGPFVVAAESLGSKQIRELRNVGSWSFVGVKGHKHVAVERVYNSAPCSVTFNWTVVGATPSKIMPAVMNWRPTVEERSPS